MELNEMEKRLLFQVEGDYQSKILNELYMTARYTKNLEQRKAAENLMEKLRVLTDAGYQKFLDSQERGEVKLKNHAKVSGGHLHYDRRDRAL